jgi:hypothetical protein
MSSKKEYTLHDIVKIHLANPDKISENELEVRFHTKSKNKLTKIDFDNVIRKLKSSNFTTTNPNGDYSLKIQNEFTDIKSGRTKMSSLRTEIKGFSSIQQYCKSNSLDKLGGSTTYMMKNYVKNGEDTIYPVDNNDLQFRISYQKEMVMKDSHPLVKQTINDWVNLKKNFRYINRVSFYHPSFPIRVDMSVVKSSVNFKQYSIQDSGVFKSAENYEIEIEVLPNVAFYKVDELESMIKKSIKTVLSGLQNTSYPIGLQQQKEVKKQYYTMLFGREKDHLVPRDFCGPASFTLELKNIQPVTDETTIPNIRNNFTVTDKADGARKLLFIDENGKIYFITTTMAIEFTGTYTSNKDHHLSILDGEHILHDKKGNYINTYAAFDIYYINEDSVREKGFVPIDSSEQPNNYRLPLLNTFTNQLQKDIKTITKKENSLIIQTKTFYLGTSEKSIFAGCNTILQKEEDGLFPYETDGLIFTPAEFGVGGSRKGEASRPMKLTWDYSFKWKPPKFNTIDFLVSVKKQGGQEFIGNIFKNGMDTGVDDQLLQYKILKLRCGFDPAKHGFLNPCQDMLEDKIPHTSGSDDNSGYQPVLFYPTNPYDNEAHICHKVLEKDVGGVFKMLCENGDVIEDNSIVEFKYVTDMDKVYRWQPIRVRYDKTAELKSGQKNYGNAYHVANGNWHSIHNPVTGSMLSTGINIPEDVLDDVYYNRNTEKTSTRGLRHFHNIGVKKVLISSVSKRGDTLIDFSVGKGGDLSKWSNSHLGFVFGLDIARDNIENKHDGACARYLKARRDSKNVPYALFVNGNSALNIRSGLASFTEKGKAITQSIFGEIPKDDNLGPAVVRHYGKVANGFDVGSCQFSLHYFFENRNTLQGFLRNVSECIKEGGYFIGTCYDGKRIFDSLKDKKRGDSCCIVKEGDEKIWEIVKEYEKENFENNETSLGYAINVYQDSINKYFREYLVNFDYFVRVMENYGFKPLAQEEAKEIGLPSGIGNFKQLYNDKLRMNYKEKQISFYNNYFVFKKVNNVNAELVKLSLSDESKFEVKLNIQDEEQVRSKPKKKKLKLVLKEPKVES